MKCSVWGCNQNAEYYIDDNICRYSTFMFFCSRHQKGFMKRIIRKRKQRPRSPYKVNFTNNPV